MRPHLGQGGCQGLEDAAVLARHLAAVAAGSAFVLPTDRDTASV
jgi:2-polyprenyl-6-methoxyphenol hydroxylase-like FAD-dependent oxidoreductase